MPAAERQPRAIHTVIALLVQPDCKKQKPQDRKWVISAWGADPAESPVPRASALQSTGLEAQTSHHSRWAAPTASAGDGGGTCSDPLLGRQELGQCFKADPRPMTWADSQQGKHGGETGEVTWRQVCLATAAHPSSSHRQAASPTPQWAPGVPQPLGEAAVEQREAGTARWAGTGGGLVSSPHERSRPPVSGRALPPQALQVPGGQAGLAKAGGGAL